MRSTAKHVGEKITNKNKLCRNGDSIEEATDTFSVFERKSCVGMYVRQ